jgi:hypothetical protein
MTAVQHSEFNDIRILENSEIRDRKGHSIGEYGLTNQRFKSRSKAVAETLRITFGREHCSNIVNGR